MTGGFDWVLGLLVLVAALRALFSKGVYEAIFSLLFLGFLMAIVWMRLDAADIALVEAAVGGGLTVAILMEAAAKHPARSAAVLKGPLFFVLGLGALALWLLMEPLSALSNRPEGQAAHLAARAHDAGTLGNPVTAVLLNFRGYDTLLEVGVLLLAALAARFFVAPPRALRPESGGFFARRMIGPLFLFAGYLLVQGTLGHGGAFQAAALLASAGVLMLLSGHLRPLESRLSGLLLAGGFLFFAAAGSLMHLVGGEFLAYQNRFESEAIFAIEAVLTLSIGWGLFVLYRQMLGVRS